MSNVKDIEEIKAAVDRMRRDKERAEGALESAMKTLTERYNCSTLEEAEALLGKYEAKLKKASKKFTQMIEAFDAKWGDKMC